MPEKYTVEQWSNDTGRWSVASHGPYLVQTTDEETANRNMLFLEGEYPETIYRVRKLDGAAYHQEERLF